MIQIMAGTGDVTELERKLYHLDKEALFIFGGFTRTPNTGGWVDAEGHTFHEEGIVYTLIGADGNPRVTTFARLVKETLGQQAVYVVCIADRHFLV